MTCRYCLKENSERALKRYTDGMDHEGSLKYVTGRDLLGLFTVILERLAPKGGSEEGGSKQEGFMHLIPYQNHDGSIDWVNGITYRTVAKTGIRGGAPYFYGPAGFLTKLGGRGEYSEIAKMYEDGDYFHNKKK